MGDNGGELSILEGNRDDGNMDLGERMGGVWGYQRERNGTRE